MRIAAVQTDIAWEDPAASFARLAPKVRDAAAAGADLVCLPEMFACGFSMDTARVQEPPGGPTTRFLEEQAREHGVFVAGSLAELPEGAARPFNTLVLAGPDGTLRRFRKLHPFTFAREHEHYGAGAEVVTWEVAGVRITPFICYDLRFADVFWDAAGATDAYLVVANWPEKRRDHWRALLRARAIENQAYVVGVNRIGAGGGLAYAGDSAVIDPWGEVLVEAARTETTLFQDLDAAVVARARERFPVLEDRRPRGPGAPP